MFVIDDSIDRVESSRVGKPRMESELGLVNRWGRLELEDDKRFELKVRLEFDHSINR